MPPRRRRNGSDGLVSTMQSLSERFLPAGSSAKKNCDDDDLVWYFSYGSNMSKSVFERRRGIRPRNSKRAVIRDWVIHYAYDSLPYMEPSFATCSPRADIPARHRDSRPDVHGVAFLITKTELERVLATEGGWGWNDDESTGGYLLVDAVAVPYEKDDKTQQPFQVKTLGSGASQRLRGEKCWQNLPSKRYRDLVAQGAIESGLNERYVNFLTQQPAYEGAHHPSLKWICILLNLPQILFVLFFNKIFLNILGMKRSPWIVCRVLYLYKKFIFLTIVLGVETVTGTSGYNNNI